MIGCNSKMTLNCSGETGAGKPLRQKRATTKCLLIKEKLYSSNTYKGNPWFCSNTLALTYPIAVGLISNGLDTRSHTSIEETLCLGMCFSIALFVFLGFQMYYFEIQADNLVVKNHYFPWIKKKFPFSNVEGVQMEKHAKRSSGLRITFDDFNSKYYAAGSLRKDTWNALLTDLSALGIKIDNI